MAFADALPADPLALMNTNNSFNDSNDVPLSLILDSAIQRTYHQLVLMSDMFPSKSEETKKAELVEFACKTWQLFLRIFALVKFKRKGHINVSNIMSFLNQQKFIFVNTANYLYDFSKIQLVNARLPNFSIPTAVDVLSTGTYPRLPTCIKERILPPEPISDEDKMNTLINLNRIIQCRLALSDLPTQFHNFSIEKGHVKFCVKNEFEIMLTVVSDDYKKPWRLLNIKILVKNPQDPNRTLVHPQQVYYMHELLQRRLYESEKPLLDLFRSLHFFCQSLKLEILFQQMTILNEITSGRFYKICEYVNSKQITIKYWLEYSKNEYDFRFTIMTGEHTDYLQTSHYPPLNWNDHKEIDQILKSNDILIEKLVHQVVKIRSKRRLMDLKTKFSSISYCSTSIDDEKPSLVVKFMNSKFENETLSIMIDYYSGLFYINIPFTPPNFNLTTLIETCLNSDISKLESNVSKLRTWFMLKRCEISLRHLSYKCTYDLPIVLFGDDDIGSYFNKIEKNRLFFQLKKTEKTFIMITCKTKEDLNNNKDETNWQDNGEFIDNKNAIRLNYYILKLLKCKYEGDIDSSMQYLKLVSISHLKRNSIMNFLDFSINNLINECGIEDSKTKTINSYEIDNNGCIYEVIKLVSSIEERLPLLNFITILSKQNLITQSIQIDTKLTNSFVNLLNVPKLESKEMKATSEILWKKVLKCKLRKIDQKILNVYYTQQNPQRPFYNRYNYSIEFLFRERIFDIQEQQNESVKSSNIDSFILYLDLKNVDDIYETFKLEWLSMCQMYRLLKQTYKAFEQYPELKKQIKILNFNFKQLVISYGHNFSYKIIFQWSKETKQFDIYPIANNSNQYSSNSIVYSHEAPSINYQFMFINEIRKMFNTKHLNIVNLIQILNETCLPSYSLAKLYNLPKFYAYQQTVVPLAGFMLLIVSLTHFKLTYYSRYCLEIHIHNNGLVSIRDGSFGLTDMNMAIEDLHPIQLLSAFLHKFWDDNVEELLKRRSSIVEDDNPMSPHQNNNNNNNNMSSFQHSSQQHQQQQVQYSNLQQHVFLPPTSPAVRQPIPPSPIHNYIAQSPGGQQNLIVPSPGTNFSNFVGSPVVGSHNSPMTLAPSPGSFMSPAPNQQTHYSVQSPVGSYDFTQSPMPIKSPFINMGPSPNPSNMNSGMSSMPVKDSLEEITKSSSRAPVGTHYKKYYSASIPIYLSHSGFMKMLSMNPETGYTPLETFLASNHLKKALLKYIQNESFRQITELNTALISFATKLLKIQIVNEITQNYAAFSLNISPLIDQLQTDILQDYFYAKILCPPYRTTAALAYFVLLNTSETKTLKEFIELLNIELNSRNPWKIKFSWQIPYSYRLKNASNNLSSHYSTYGPGFTRKENKYHFLINLVNTPMHRGPSQQIVMPFLISYDPIQAFITHEYIKLNQHEPIGPSENRVIGLVNHWIESAKLRPIDSPLVFSFTQVLNALNQIQPPSTPMPHQMH